MTGAPGSGAVSREIYKGNTIEVESFSVADGWSLRARIYDADGTLRKEFDALGHITFATVAEARRLGRFIAQEWIDDHATRRP